MLSYGKLAIPAALLSLFTTTPGAASVVFFSTGDPDGKMATATRPASAGNFEIESADDFVLTSGSSITSATFTGLIPRGSSLNITDVVVEIYRVFPADSDVGRTSGPPTFSTSQVPTRVNSPSDVAFASRDSASGALSFATTDLSPNFTALNSVQPGGIHPKPGQTTGGDGAVTGHEVQINVTFTTPFILPGDHYFFVPQVELANGDFLWLSAPKPIVSPGTPFPAGFTDLQSWTRDQFLDPDWLRVGTDIVGQGTFNAAFSLTGVTIPEPMTVTLVGLGLGAIGLRRSRRPVASA
jgi:hypothetical protein